MFAIHKNPPVPKTLIFDFDGTLIISMPTVLRVFAQIAQKHGLDPVTAAQAETLRDLSARELIAQFHFSPLQVIRLVRHMNAEIAKEIESIPLAPGMQNVLSRLSAAGHTLGIISSNNEPTITKYLLAHNLTQFNWIYCEKNLFGKAHLLRKTSKRHAFALRDAYYIGDEVRDIEAARAAGVHAVSVTWGFNSAKALEAKKPDFLIHTPEDLLAIFPDTQ